MKPRNAFAGLIDSSELKYDDDISSLEETEVLKLRKGSSINLIYVSRASMGRNQWTEFGTILVKLTNGFSTHHPLSHLIVTEVAIIQQFMLVP